MIEANNAHTLHIQEGIVVESSILEKIQMLTKNKNNGKSIDKEDSNKSLEINRIKEEITQRINTLDLEKKDNVLCWAISDCVCLIPESSATKTSIKEKRNNIDEIINFLDEKYGDNYLVITFRKTRITNQFKRCLAFEDIQKYDLINTYKLTQVCNFWINTKEKRTIVIELKNGLESQGLFMVSCILAHCKLYLSAEVALNTLLKNNQTIWKFSNIETIIRYVKYYDLAVSQGYTNKIPQLILNQMIVTTIPSIIQSGDFLPKLRIETNCKMFEFSLENCYKDADYIIFSNLEAEMVGDTKLSLIFEQEKKVYLVFDLCVNPLFYNQGLYRFSRSEVMTALPQESIYQFFQNGFYIDLVFLENQDGSIKNPFSLPLSMFDLINLIVLKISNESVIDTFENEFYIQLLDKGFNSVLAKFCAYFQMSEEESLVWHSKFEESGYRNGLLRQNFDLEITEEIKREELKIERSENKDPDFELFLENSDFMEIGEVELLKNDSLMKESLKKPTFSLFNRQKPTPIPNLEVNENIVAKKPLHLVSIKAIENTIFDEIKEIYVPIDYNAIESIFCENVALVTNNFKTQYIQKHRIDSKRIFMVSLLFKQLEIKKIFIDDIEHIFKNMPERIGIQELQSLYKLIPTPEEILLIEKNDETEVSDIEMKMLKLSKIPEITKILNILIFEKSYVEEIILMERLIDCTNITINKILTDFTLKFILKIVLDISNALNYTYGRKKKIIEGFKLESLYFLSAYRGSRDKSFIDLIVVALAKNNITFSKITSKFKDLNNLKNEDFGGLKDKINNLILKYKEVLNNFKNIEEYDKDQHTKIISFAYRKLLQISEKFKDLEKNCISLRVKMGEDDKKPINCIFKSLSDFILCLESAERKRFQDN